MTTNPNKGTVNAIKHDKTQNKKLKKQAIRNQEYYQMVEVTDKLYKQSQEGKIFTNLMDLILEPSNIRLAFRNLRSNKGSYTPGTDNLTIRDIAQMEEEELIEIVRKKLKEYKPKPIRRVNIPKPGTNKTRPLGIPCILDRLIQQSIKQILEPILEAKFYPYSYGFRPDRDVEGAIHRTSMLINTGMLHYVVDVDIKGFFDNVNHNKLRKQLWTLGIRDKKLLSIIQAIVCSPIKMPDGRIFHPDKGTGQGAVISPILANVVLNELDWWISSQWENFPLKYATRNIKQDYAVPGTKHRALKNTTNLKEMYIVRFADDFKILTRTRDEAEKIKLAVIAWLDDRLHLQTAPEKTGITNLRKKNTEFLGFKLKVRKKGDRFVVVSHMSDKAKKKVTQNLNEQLKKVSHPTDDHNQVQEINKLNSLIMGVHQYYGLATEVNADLQEINKGFRIKLHNQVLKGLKDCKEGTLGELSAIYKKYGKSKQLRFVNGVPVVPLAYCKTSPPMGKDKNLSRYTPEGREKLHKDLGVSLAELHRLMTQEIRPNVTIEYFNNRIALFCAQYGKCYVTGIKLTADEIHCHHIIPRAREPNDSYDNLIIVHSDVHKLIHAKEVDTIAKYLPILNGDKKAIKRLNKLRTLAGNFEINNLSYGGIQVSFFDQF